MAFECNHRDEVIACLGEHEYVAHLKCVRKHTEGFAEIEFEGMKLMVGGRCSRHISLYIAQTDLGGP